MLHANFCSLFALVLFRELTGWHVLFGLGLGFCHCHCHCLWFVWGYLIYLLEMGELIYELAEPQAVFGSCLSLEWDLIPHTQSRLLIPPSDVTYTSRMSLSIYFIIVCRKDLVCVTSVRDYDGRCASSGHRLPTLLRPDSWDWQWHIVIINTFLCV